MKVQFWTSRVLVAVVGGSVIAAPSAEARAPDGPPKDDLEEACQNLQDDIDNMADEYNDPNTSDARREEIINLALGDLAVWNKIGCDDRYGSIFFRPILVVCGGAVEPCTPIADTMQDSDGDQIADLWELDLGMDPLNPDTNGNKILDGVDASWLSDLVGKLSPSEIVVPEGVDFELHLDELVEQAHDVALECSDGKLEVATDRLTTLEDELGCAYDSKSLDGPNLACEALEILRFNLAE